MFEMCQRKNNSKIGHFLRENSSALGVSILDHIQRHVLILHCENRIIDARFNRAVLDSSCPTQHDHIVLQQNVQMPARIKDHKILVVKICEQKIV